MIVLYNILLVIAIVLGFPLIIPFVLISDKRRKTVLPRLGLTKTATGAIPKKGFYPDRKPIWIHALSVGEVLAAVPLVQGIIDGFKNRNVLVSVSTKTGFEVADQRFKGMVNAVIYYPYDLAFSVKHIAGKIDPALVVIVESDIWPNFLSEMKTRQVPVILANARLSKRSFAGYKRLAVFSKSLFLSFTSICTQSAEDAERFKALGVPSSRITVSGNIKFDQGSPAMPESEIKNMRQSTHVRLSQKVFMAGSTHKGEETVLLEAFTRMKQEFEDLLLIVVPRDPGRAGSVQRIFQSARFHAVLMKELSMLAADSRIDVIVVDAIGVLKKLYALANVAFVGGSLVNCGGHNPLEPAVFSKPILFGYDMSDFAEIAQMLVAAGGAARVQDAEDLYNVASKLFRDHQQACKMGNRAFEVFNANKGAVDRTLKVIAESLF